VVILFLLMWSERRRGEVRSPAKSAGMKRWTPADMEALIRFICSGSLGHDELDMRFSGRRFVDR
jgi:hypothetical protein